MDILYLLLKIIYIAGFIALSVACIYLSVKAPMIKMELQSIEKECVDQRREFISKPFLISAFFNQTAKQGVDLMQQLGPAKKFRTIFDLYKIIKEARKS